MGVSVFTCPYGPPRGWEQIRSALRALRLRSLPRGIEVSVDVGCVVGGAAEQVINRSLKLRPPIHIVVAVFVTHLLCAKDAVERVIACPTSYIVCAREPVDLVRPLGA